MVKYFSDIVVIRIIATILFFHFVVLGEKSDANNLHLNYPVNKRKYIKLSHECSLSGSQPVNKTVFLSGECPSKNCLLLHANSLHAKINYAIPTNSKFTAPGLPVDLIKQRGFNPINAPPENPKTENPYHQPFKSKAIFHSLAESGKQFHENLIVSSEPFLSESFALNPLYETSYNTNGASPGKSADLTDDNLQTLKTINQDQLLLECPADISTYTDINECSGFVSGGLNPGFDETKVVTLTWEMAGAMEDASPAEGIHLIEEYTFDEGATIITYTATTADGSTTTCTFTVTISDNQVPRLENMPADITVEAAPGNCSATVYWMEPVATDNCTPNRLILKEPTARSGDEFPVGTTRVEYMAYDAMGNESQPRSFTITVEDAEPPVFSLPPDTAIQCGEEIPAPITWQQFTASGGSATDNCAIDPISFRLLSETKSRETCPYTLTRMYEIADEAGNTVTAEHRIVVEGEEVAAETEEEVELKSGQASYTATQNGPWNDQATWGGAGPPTSTDDVTIPTGITVTAVDITIDASGSITLEGGASLEVSGNWTNNGTFAAGTNSNVIFTGTTSPVFISGTSTTIFKNFELNKGTGNILEVNSDIELDGTITFTSGTMEINSGTTVTCTHNAGFSIEADAGMVIVGGTFTSGAFTVENKGLFQIDNGTVNIGTVSGNSLFVGSAGTFRMNNGTLNVAGRLQISGGLAEITGGTINLNTVGHSSTTIATLQLSLASDFNMTGGTINFLNPNSSGYLDVSILDGTGGNKSFTGGTFNFGTGSAETYQIASHVPFPDISAASNANLVLELEVSSYGTYNFPLVDGSGNSIPASVILNSGTINSGAFIRIETSGTKHPENKSASNFLDRYWTITTSGITNPNYDVTVEYSNVDISGSEAEIAAGLWTGSLPWEKDGGANTSVNTITFTGITAATANISGITLAPPTVEIDQGETTEVCEGSSINLTTTATGDPTITYQWSSTPSGFNSTNADVTVTPSVNTTYTVTVTDGNGFTATDDIQITVEPLPSASAGGSTTICENESATVSGASADNGTILWTHDGAGSITSGATTQTPTYTSTSGDAGNTVTLTMTVTGNNTCNTETATATYTIDVEPNHTINLTSAAETENQTLCLPNSITDITYAVGGGATDATVTGLPSGVTGNFSGGVFTISGTPTVAGTFDYTVTTTGNSCGAATANGSLVVHPTPTVKITIDGTSTICEGTNVTFNTTVTDAGTTPTFQWQVNGTDISETGDSFSSSTLANGDVVRVIMTADPNHCSSVITSNSYTMTVNPTVYPSVTVLESNDDICDGETVTFNATVVNGGPSPSYQWHVNGSPQSGETDASFVTSSLSDGDQVHVSVVSSANCADLNPVESTPVVITVNSIVVPSVSIAADNSTICPGETVSFSVDSETNQGTNPSYQWKVNGNSVGTDLPTYSTNTLNDNDVVTLEMTSNARCASPATVESNLVTISVNPGTPAIPGAITGNNQVCPSTTETYSISTVTDATSYTWSLPTDWSIDSGSGTESITVSVGPSAQSGNITVTALNNCGTSDARTFAVNVGTVSTNPTGISITDNNTCETISKTLTVTGGSLGTGAQWVWYTDGCGTTQVGTGSSITADPPAGSTTTYYVRAEGNCNTTECAQEDVIVNPGAPAQPGAITGTTPVCPATASLTYSISSVTDATSYNWAVPAGWTITNGQGTETITVTSGAAGQNGNISVTASNSCGTSTAQTLAVEVAPGTPAAPEEIAGLADQCMNATGLTYSVPVVPNATTYNWTLPSGWTITSGDGTNSIIVSTDGAASSGDIIVTATNSCGTSPASTLPVTVYPAAPVQPGPIDGVTAICPAISAVYTIDPVDNATSYTWTYPSGWIVDGGQGTTSLSVTVPIGASSGDVTVTADNVCGSSVSSSIQVSVANDATVYAGPDKVVCEGTSWAYLEGETGGAIDKKQEWDWESVTPGGVFDNPDDLNTLYTFPAGFTTGEILIAIHSTESVGGCQYVSDTMKITVLPNPTASIVSTDTVCNGEAGTVTISATPNSTVTYRINLDVPKTVNIDDSGIATVTTAPLTSDATFTLRTVKYTAYTCQTVLDEAVSIKVNPLAVADAGTDQTICSSSPDVSLAGSVSGAITTGTWTGGAGTFTPAANDLNAVYTPTANEIAAGTLTLTLTSDDPDGPCGTASDDITITFEQAATVYAGADQIICSDGTVTLTGSIGGSASSATWISDSGTPGTFSDAGALNATYTPSAAEITAGSVELILTTNDPSGVCTPVSDTVAITINPAATVDAGSDQTICASSSVVLSGSIGGGAGSATWSGGNGTFDPEITALNATYTPTADEISDGSVTLTLTTDDPDGAGPCEPQTDQVTITIDPAAVVNAGIDESVCEGSTIILNGSIGGAANSATWSTVSGSGSFSDVNALNAVYTHEPGVTGIVELVLTSDDPSGTCGVVTDTMQLTVDPTIAVTVGNDTMICSDANIELDGSVETGTGTWSTSGSGTFTPNTTTPNAVYTPSNGDILNGEAILTYTSEDPPGICGPVSASMTLTVKEIITVTTQPVNTGVCSSNPADIFIEAVGDDLTYQWYRIDGSTVANTSNISGAQSPTLHFNNATSADIDSYYVVISSPTACDTEVSDTVTLNVDEEINVTTPLESDSVCVGNDITFNIVAEPGGSLTYQWRRDGVDLVDGGNISGATTNELILTNVSLADSGSYTVYMEGLAGYTCTDAESAPGYLHVIDNASILPADQSATFCLGAPIDTIRYVVDGGATNASVPAGDLPPGLTGSYDTDTKEFIITGTPATAGTFNFTVTTTGNCIQASATGTIEINDQLVPPTISADQTICYNSPPNPLTTTTDATGGTGPYSYQWQDSISGGNWTDINEETANSFNPPALIDTTYYRMIATDTGDPSCGSAISNEITIIPVDTIAPTFTVPPDFPLTADGSCGGNTDPSRTGEIISTSYNDNCSDNAYLIANTTYFDHDTILNSCGYSFERTWTVTDEAGNESQQIQTITLEDNTPPTLSAPTGQTLSCEQDTTPAALGYATAVDNCDSDPVITYYDVVTPGSCSGDYTFVRHWIGTDACGNADTISRNYSVTDNVDPVIVNPGDTVVECVTDIPVADPSVFEYYDACGSTTIELVDEIAHDLDTEAGYCPYQVVRTWRVTDDCNNFTEFEQTISIVQDASCAPCSECLYNNTLHVADFTGDPSGDTTFVNVVKQDKCCGAENEPGSQTLFCASFKIKLDPGAVGVEIITSDVTPPGQSWKVNCEDVDGGEVVCLPSGEFQLFTFCKNAASNEPQDNDYTFRSVQGIIASGDIETREECDEVLEATGDFSNPTWTSIYPGAQGEYDHLLSSTTDSLVYFNAEPGSPEHIQYMVCGEISATLCAQTTGGLVCDTVDVYVRPAIEMELDINPDLICEDYIPEVTPIISPAGAYDLEWYVGATPSGVPDYTGPSYTPQTSGWYSVVAVDNTTGLDCNRDTFSFEMLYDLTGPTIKSPPEPLYLQCNTSNYAGLIDDWLNSATAEYVNEVGDTIEFTPTNNYYDGPGINMACGDSLLVTFIAQDQCSNDTTTTSYIIVEDDIAPVINPEASDGFAECTSDDPDQNTAYQDWLAIHGGADATDDCDLDLTWAADTATATWSGDPAYNQITVTFTVTDDCLNSDSTTATFTITDTAPPEITCPDDVTETAAANNCSKTLDSPTDPVMSDICSDPVLTWEMTGATTGTGTGTVTGETFNVGVTTVTYIATDAAGLTDSCTFSVTIVDVTPPNLSLTDCQDVTGYMDATDCFAELPPMTDPLYSDDCWDLDSLVLSFEITGAWDTTGTGYVSGFEFPVGISTVTYTVTDPDSNSVSCSFTVTMLQDAISSTVFNCPPEDTITYTLGPTECEAFINVPAPTINEICETATYTITNNYTSGTANADTIYPVGITEVVWTISDNSGNDTTCIVYVDVSGVQLPTIDCPDNVTGTMTSDNCVAVPPDLGDPTYSAPCWPNDSLDLTYRIVSGNGVWDTTGVNIIPDDLEFPVGVNTVTYYVTDPDGNIDSCSFTVTMLQDAISSTVFNCPPEDTITYTLGPTECEAFINVPAPTINEICETATYYITNNYTSETTNADTIYPVGITEVVWTISDGLGNDTTCIVYVEVSGVQLPTIDCPDNVTGTMTSDNCEAIPPDLGDPAYSAPCWPNDSLDLTYRIVSGNGVWDTTGIDIIPDDLEFPVGVNTVTYYVTDPDGNIDSCSFTVTMLQDAVPSTAYTCPPNPADATVDSFSCDAWIDIDPPTIDDHCVTATYSINHDSPYAFGTDSTDASGNYPIGQHTITWTISDNSGNDTTCIQTFEVFDLEPRLVCPPSIEVWADFDQPYASGVTVGLPDYWDNCDSTLIYTVTTPDSITTVYDSDPDSINLLTGEHTYDLGVTTIEYTFRDGNGHEVVCDFTVTVIGAPVIDCPPDTIVYLDGTESTCAATFDPGVPDLIEGVPPITWTYTINYADGTSDAGSYEKPDPTDPSSDRYPNLLGDKSFPLGITTIEWRAENEAGFDTCSHWVEVIDTIPPTFTTAPYENCVDPLHWAVYDPANANPVVNHIVPLVNKFPVDYRTLPAGDTSLDLITLEDNCCDSVDMIINWRIDFTDTPDPQNAGIDISHPPISGTGLPSEYDEDNDGVTDPILLWGDGVQFNDVTHTITYWVEDCNGNISDEYTELIVITPRPQITKQDY